MNVYPTVLDLVLVSSVVSAAFVLVPCPQISEASMESWAPNSASSEERFAFPSEDVAVTVYFILYNFHMKDE